MRPPAPDARTVLIVEDEWLIADAIEFALNDAGFRTAGPAASVGEALVELGRHSIDLAVLDANLGVEPSFPVADRLAAAGVPFLFVTGYAAADLPPRFAAVQVLNKPVPPGLLVDKVRAMLDRADSSPAYSRSIVS